MVTNTTPKQMRTRFPISIITKPKPDPAFDHSFLLWRPPRLRHLLSAQRLVACGADCEGHMMELSLFLSVLSRGRQRTRTERKTKASAVQLKQLRRSSLCLRAWKPLPQPFIYIRATKPPQRAKPGRSINRTLHRRCCCVPLRSC